MKKLHLILMLSVAFLVVSCTKDKTTTPTTTPEKTCLVQKIVYSDGRSDAFTFDSQNRLIKTVIAQDTMMSQMDMSYNGNIVTTSISGLPFSLTYLNAKGFADSVVSSFQGFIETKTVNTFNSSGLLISQSTKGIQFGSPVNDLFTFEYVGENKSKQTFTDGTNTFTTVYEYYLDKKNNSKKSQVAQYFENANANLVKKATTNLGDITNYTYEFNSDGLETKRIATGGTPSQTFTSVYTWSCK
jgi:hypothetical protein